MKKNIPNNKPAEKMSYYTLLVYMITGALGAGYFHTRSFLALDALLFTAALVYILRTGRIKLLPVHFFLLILTLLYWLSAIWAVDVEQALLEAGKISSLLPLSLLFAGLSRELRDRIWSAWAWCGTALILWGLAFGLFREGRLESTLGYANSFAVILAAGVAAGWRAYKLSGHKRYWIVCVIQIGGLLWTGSRAVLVLAVIGAVIYVFLNRDAQKVSMLGTMAASVLLAVVLAFAARNGGEAFREIAWNAPEFALRRIYWSDAFHLWLKHWLLGVGGGGWAVLYPSVYVKYVHQQYLQVALDTGVFGALSFIGMIIFSIRAGLRRGKEGWGSMLAIILFCAHLAFDIDLAYPLVFGLFIMLLTGAEAEGGPGQEIPLPRFRAAALALPAVIAVFFFSWLTVGYTSLANGKSAIARQDWERAERSLIAAAAQLPWSHETHYELAALYSAIARSQGDESYMQKALEEMRTASDMIPENRSYKEMVKQAENGGQ
ncbi:O-antigen ligase family protein [Paenibacillus sp. 22594]|uniref:O-antigen ligase family protein n=1 Tax=Paenibacillus sp. 22594 TaxID=3453947 RepID=UPI003F855802